MREIIHVQARQCGNQIGAGMVADTLSNLNTLLVNGEGSVDDFLSSLVLWSVPCLCQSRNGALSRTLLLALLLVGVGLLPLVSAGCAVTPSIGHVEIPASWTSMDATLRCV